jgi:alkanesulfonate monooxygenase SsuD/methylene tetrahydromethanopterin reductase-like flavin-dependent oxidoreductase (luciferase family)
MRGCYKILHMSGDAPLIGLVLGSSLAPEAIVPAACAAEQHGVDEVWLAEDMFFTGGISGANQVLAATERIRVGLGVVSAMVRHPALLAVELATTARVHPGRLMPGIGLGVPAWMRQMGLHPRSPVNAVRECVEIVRALLAGEIVNSVEGAVFHCADLRLEYPVDGQLPLHVGVVGPRMLEMSGQVADGTILSVGAGAAYVSAARDHIDAGRDRAGRHDPHRVTQFAITAIDRDRRRARTAAAETLTFYMLAGGRNAITDAHGISDAIDEMVGSGRSVAELAADIPDPWIDELTIAGTPDEAADRLHALAGAGADAVALFPAAGPTAATTLDLLGADVLPQLR